jgi:uncharacterized protein (UPF0332 family)
VKEVDDLLTKAERSFAAAELLLGAGDADFAASRAYYGYFYVAQGLLIHRGIRPRSHAGLLRQYGLHFEKTGVLEGGFGRWLERAFSLRQIADYGSAPQAPTPEDVRQLIERGRAFLEAARGHLGHEGGDP